MAKLQLAIDGGKVSLELELPMEDAVGFERAPRNPKEKAMITEVTGKLRDAGTIFKFNPEAKCKPTRGDVKSAALEQGKDSKEEHAEFEASYEFTCEQAAALKGVDVNLFDVLKGVKRIDATAVTPRGQTLGRLTAAKRKLAW